MSSLSSIWKNRFFHRAGLQSVKEIRTNSFARVSVVTLLGCQNSDRAYTIPLTYKRKQEMALLKCTNPHKVDEEMKVIDGAKMHIPSIVAMFFMRLATMLWKYACTYKRELPTPGHSGYTLPLCQGVCNSIIASKTSYLNRY